MTLKQNMKQYETHERRLFPTQLQRWACRSGFNWCQFVYVADWIDATYDRFTSKGEDSNFGYPQSFDLWSNPLVQNVAPLLEVYQITWHPGDTGSTRKKKMDYPWLSSPSVLSGQCSSMDPSFLLALCCGMSQALGAMKLRVRHETTQLQDIIPIWINKIRYIFVSEHRGWNDYLIHFASFWY